VSDSAKGYSSGGPGAGVFDSEFGGKKADGRSGPKKIEANLTWDAMVRKYLEMFEEANQKRK
jgi:hypothetical protein